MRTSVRVFGVAAAATAAMALGSPAFAGGGGDGGDGGESANNLSCSINIAVISPNASDPSCNSSADGGDGGK